MSTLFGAKTRPIVRFKCPKPRLAKFDASWQPIIALRATLVPNGLQILIHNPGSPVRLSMRPLHDTPPKTNQQIASYVAISCRQIQTGPLNGVSLALLERLAASFFKMVRSSRNTPTDGSKRANTPDASGTNHANTVSAGNTSDSVSHTAPAAPPTATTTPVVNSSTPAPPSAPAPPAPVPAAPANAPAQANPNLVRSGLPNPDLFDRSYYGTGKRKFHLVTVGRELGMHPDWFSCQSAVNGVSGATHQQVDWDEGIEILCRELAAQRVGYSAASIRAQRRAASAPPSFGVNAAPAVNNSTGAAAAPTTPAAPANGGDATPTRRSNNAPCMLTAQPTPPSRATSAQVHTPRILFPSQDGHASRARTRTPDIIPETPLASLNPPGDPESNLAPPGLATAITPGRAGNPIYYTPSPTPVPTPGRPSNPIGVNSSPAGPAQPALQWAVPTRQAQNVNAEENRQRHFARRGRARYRTVTRWRRNPFTNRREAVEYIEEAIEEDEDEEEDEEAEEERVDKEKEDEKDDSGDEGKGREQDGKEPAPRVESAVDARQEEVPAERVYSDVGTQTKTVFLLSALSSPEQSPSRGSDAGSDIEDYFTATESTPSPGSDGSRKRKSPADEEEDDTLPTPLNRSGRPFVALFDSPEGGPSSIPAYPRAGPPDIFSTRLLNLQRPSSPLDPNIPSDAATYASSCSEREMPSSPGEENSSDTDYAIAKAETDFVNKRRRRR